MVYTDLSSIKSIGRILIDYEIGEPWKLSKGAGFVVPILGRPPFPDRNYVLLQEVLDKVSFEDTGGIGGVNVSNESGSNVFLRKGTMLKGMGTQSRSPVAGVVLEPIKEAIRIPVNCIHASHGISGGASFTAVGVAPHSVYQSLGRQSDTWENISRYSARAGAGIMRAGGSSGVALSGRLTGLTCGPDALVDVEESVEKFKDEVDDLLKQIPGDHVNQLGVAVFDLKGVLGIEVFDHPDSWHAFSKSIIRSYSEVLTEKVADLYEIRMDRAEPVLRDFLGRVSDAERKLVTSNRVSKVWALSAEGVDGELAEVEGREIHLVLSRSAERGQLQTPQRLFAGIPREGRDGRTVVGTYANEGIFTTTTMVHPPDWYRRQGSMDLLQRLDEKPSRFTELLSNMDVSRGTLGSRIREASDMGLIHKSIREDNGYSVWSLTTQGKAESKQLKMGS